MKGKSTWFRGVYDADLHRLLTNGSTLNPATTPSGTPTFLRPPGPTTNPVIYQPPDCGKLLFVWIPDIAVKLITLADCPSDADLAELKAVLGGNLSAFSLPDPDIRVKCQGGTIFISIWGTRVPPNSCADLSRQQAHNLFGDPDPQNDKLSDISNGGNFGIYVGATLIQLLAQKAFGQSPKAFNENGIADDHGPIHLTGLSVAFPSDSDVNNGTNHFITTILHGYEDASWPSISFTTTLTDQLKVTDGLPDCDTTSATQEDDLAVIAAVVFDILVGALSTIIPALWGVEAFLLVGDIDAVLIHSGGNSQSGVGCKVYESLPIEIPLPLPPPTILQLQRPNVPITEGVRPEKMKIQLTYQRVWADSRGLFTSASAEKVRRIPGAEIVGPQSLIIDLNGSSTFGTFTVEPRDFFGNLTYSWSGGAVASPNTQNTQIRFARGNAQPGDIFERSITVEVTDSEGGRATASLTVSIIVSTVHIPPFCKSKPWLQQCKL